MTIDVAATTIANAERWQLVRIRIRASPCARGRQWIFVMSISITAAMQVCRHAECAQRERLGRTAV